MFAIAWQRTYTDDNFIYFQFHSMEHQGNGLIYLYMILNNTCIHSIRATKQIPYHKVT